MGWKGGGFGMINHEGTRRCGENQSGSRMRTSKTSMKGGKEIYKLIELFENLSP